MASASGKSPISPTSPSWPTFLDTDPFPSSRDARPTSAGSTVTNATSDFGGDDSRASREHTRTLASTTGPVGEPGLPPSRPTSVGVEASRRTSLQLPGSRKGSSRPGTGTNKTHVPTLPAQTFFRPMSSQKLQAQRNQLASIGAATEGDARNEMSGSTSQDERPKDRRRYSDASVNTLKEAQAMRRDEEVPPLPVSRGTQLTSDGENTTIGGSVTSATPLHSRQNGTRNLDAGELMPSKGQLPDQRSKSPLSLRASSGMVSKNGRLEQEQRLPTAGHEKLGSHPSSPTPAEKTVAAQSSRPRPTKSAGKNYEYFAGNLLFCLSGRCMNTKAQPLNVLTFVLTVAPAALFGAFSAPWLWLHISPALPIVFAYIFLITASSFIHAAVSDPGILPRNIHPHPPNPEEERDPLTVGPTTTEWVMVKTFPSSHRSPLPDRPNNASGEAGTEMNGPTTAMEVPTKYCKTCNIWRPPRTHHCRVCDACIETQDHHCVWLNNCVGRRNYRYFFTYVSFGSLLALMLLAFSLIHVIYYAKRHNISFLDSFTGRTQERVAFAMFLYAILALPYPGSLFIYHLFLITRGETTREYLNSHKFMKKDRHRPFTQASPLRNCIAVLVRPRPPTYMQFKHAYQPGDVRFGHTAPKKQRKRELKGKYSVPENGAGAVNGTRKPVAGDVEMKQLSTPPSAGGPPGPAAKPQAKSAGGLTGPVNRTPR